MVRHVTDLNLLGQRVRPCSEVFGFDEPFYLIVRPHVAVIFNRSDLVDNLNGHVTCGEGGCNRASVRKMIQTGVW